MYANLSLEHGFLRTSLKKAPKPCERKELAQDVVNEGGLSISRDCLLVSLSRSMWYYRTTRDDSEVIDKLVEMIEIKPNRGFDYYYHSIHTQGFKWNRKRVLRIYRLMGLQLRRKRKKPLPARIKTPLEQSREPLQVWRVDSMSDSLITCRNFRMFNLMDDFETGKSS